MNIATPGATFLSGQHTKGNLMTAQSTQAPAQDFGDRRVFVKHDTGTVGIHGGTAYWCQSARGPIQIYVSGSSTSEAAIADLSMRHSVDAGALREFCTTATPGTVKELRA